MIDPKEIFVECPVATGVELIKRKWLLLIVRDLYSGRTHFNEFKEENPSITNKVLADCLRDMEEKGLITKISNDETNKFDTEYHLTERGRKLNHVLYALGSYITDTHPYYEEYGEKEKSEIKSYLKNKYDIKSDF